MIINYRGPKGVLIRLVDHVDQHQKVMIHFTIYNINMCLRPTGASLNILHRQRVGHLKPSILPKKLVANLNINVGELYGEKDIYPN